MKQHKNNMSGDIHDLARYRLDCAAQELKDAVLLLKNESFNSANNRSYYAIFHAINAIHALDGRGYKRHKDALGNFNKDYIKEGIFPREYGRKISLAANTRRNSDYVDYHYATMEEAQEQIDFAEEFVDAVRNYCIERMGEEGKRNEV